MYCPSCGANNLDDLKFCTRCGTNLGLVSDALEGRTTASLDIDEKTVALFKDYYRGRRMMLIGGAASALSLFKLAGPFMLGFPEKLIPIVILSLGFLLLSLLAFVWGLVKWNNSSSEIKALGVSPTRKKVFSPQSMQSLSTPNSPILDLPAPLPDAVAAQITVTERTTHLLDDEPHAVAKARLE